MKDFEELAHTADMRMRVSGRDLKTLFINAARGMYYLAGVPRKGKAGRVVSVEVEGLDEVDLLARWLNELLYRLNVKHTVLHNIDIKTLLPTKLHATGNQFHLKPADVQVELKAATYHNLKITREGKVFSTEIIFDV